jgi:N-acetylglutamate synthase-like GNAT family acetyltransferase
MKIAYLADHPEFLRTLAEWQHGEWGHLRPGDTVEARMVRLGGSEEPDRIPLTVVAHENGEVRGSASLIAHDMDTRMELTPWLAGVFVAPEHRCRGIGAALVRRIMAEAGRLNVPVLYLYTVHSENFYAGLDWSLLEHTTYREQHIAIMNWRPTPTEP